MEPRHVYLVRHGHAEPDHRDGDAARPLTPAGRERFRALVESLRPRLTLRHILTSPYVRARETADLLAEATGATVEEDPRLAAGSCTGTQLLDLLRQAGPGVALVGHNPEVAEAVALVAMTSEKVRPGTVVALAPAPSLSLAWLAAPPERG